MNITRNNYEAFFLDFLEGNLEERSIDQFLDFLEQNPDLKEELQLFEDVRLSGEEMLFSEKELLYKSTIYEKEVLDNKFIAYLENDLEPADRKLFESRLEVNPEFQREYQLFVKTRLIPEEGIIFPAKNKLYRKSGKAVVLNWVARVAAVVVLLWGISTVFQMQNQPGEQLINSQISEINPAIETSVEKVDPSEKVEAITKKGNQVKVPKSNIVKPIIRQRSKVQLAEKQTTVHTEIPERDIEPLNEIQPILAQIDTKSEEVQLAVSFVHKPGTNEEVPDVLTVDEFLAIRVKKVGNESWLSAQRIVRAGLGIASEISGERIGYAVKDGKISSLEFESKLLAFSIPLEKTK